MAPRGHSARSTNNGQSTNIRSGTNDGGGSLKDEFQVNIRLASADQFLPPLPDWKAQSRLITRHGEVEFFRYDLRSQSLAKLARAPDRDLLDVRAMLDLTLVTRHEILEGLDQIRDQLIRYPALDADAFEHRVRRFLVTDND